MSGVDFMSAAQARKLATSVNEPVDVGADIDDVIDEVIKTAERRIKVQAKAGRRTSFVTLPNTVKHNDLIEGAVISFLKEQGYTVRPSESSQRTYRITW